MMRTPREHAPREFISGLDDLTYRVTLRDAKTNAPITSGTVTMRLVQRLTVTPLHPTAAVCALTHTANGEWVGDHDAVDVLTAMTAGRVPVQGEFDRVVVVDGLTGGRLVAVCVRVAAA